MSARNTNYLFILEGEEFIKAIEDRGKKLEPLAGDRIKSAILSFFVERKLLVQLEEELSTEAVQKRVEEAIRSYRFSSF